MTRLAAVLFDLDGVLVDSIAAWESLLRDAIQHFGGRPLEAGEYPAVFGQSSAADRDRFFPGLPLEELDRYYRDHFRVRTGLVTVGEGAPEALRACRDLGLRTAVVTNTDGAVARSVLAAAALLPWLDTVVGVDEVQAGKPAPDMVIEAARRLAVDTAEAVMVGDSRFDVAAARAAGVVAIGLGQPADLTISSLLDLPGLLRARAAPL